MIPTPYLGGSMTYANPSAVLSYRQNYGVAEENDLGDEGANHEMAKKQVSE